MIIEVPQNSPKMIELQAIATVKNERLKPEDDNWNSVISEITLSEGIPEKALDGIQTFSHLNIIFYMDQVSDEKAIAQSRHPRNNTDFPVVGTFGQRNKSRPNKIGLTCCELLEVTGRTLRVRGLDAINGTPVLDIKPVFEEFLPKGEIRQPAWTRDIMKNYW